MKNQHLLSIPKYTQIMVDRKLKIFEENRLNRNYNFKDFYFVISLISATCGELSLSDKEIELRNTLIRLYEGESFRISLKSTHKIDYTRKEGALQGDRDWERAVKVKLSLNRSKVLNYIVSLVNKDLKNIITPFLQRAKIQSEELQDDFYEARGSNVIGVFQMWGEEE